MESTDVDKPNTEDYNSKENHCEQSNHYVQYVPDTKRNICQVFDNNIFDLLIGFTHTYNRKISKALTSEWR